MQLCGQRTPWGRYAAGPKQSAHHTRTGPETRDRNPRGILLRSNGRSLSPIIKTLTRSSVILHASRATYPTPRQFTRAHPCGRVGNKRCRRHYHRPASRHWLLRSAHADAGRTRPTPLPLPREFRHGTPPHPRRREYTSLCRSAGMIVRTCGWHPRKYGAAGLFGCAVPPALIAPAKCAERIMRARDAKVNVPRQQSSSTPPVPTRHLASAAEEGLANVSPYAISKMY
jgi:hypothetical protein